MKRTEYYSQLALPGFTPKMQPQIEHQPCFLASELPEDIQDEIVEKHRDFNTDDCSAWWDPIYEGFKERMKGIGISVRDIYFSGFWSQGDGACFEGCMDDNKKFIQHLIDNNALPPNVKLKWLFKNQKYNDALGDLSVSIKHSGHYYHSGCMDVSVEFDDQLYDDNDEAYDMLTQEQYGEMDDFVQSYIKEQADDLYHDLSDYYDDLSSKESILEGLDANEYYFWSNGVSADNDYEY